METNENCQSTSKQLRDNNGIEADRESDRFCWSCHKKEPTLFCVSCIRSFHNTWTCSGSKNLDKEEMKRWHCPVCIAIHNDQQRINEAQIDAKYVQKLLKIIFSNLNDDVDLVGNFMTIDYSKMRAKYVVNPIDLNAIEVKINHLSYKCFESFFSDIKWIVHNTKIFRSGDKDAIKSTRWLLDLVKEEIYAIRMCAECYVHLTEKRIELVCRNPHLIVWAKQKTYPYWPAKLMSVSGGMAEVRYFGDKHLRASIPVKDCYLYSADNPSIMLGAYKQSLLEARAEADLCIEQLKKKYGTFNLAPSNTLLNANQLERHLYDVIPNAWKQLGKTEIPPPIRKPTAGSATIARRLSVPVRKFSPSSQTPSPHSLVHPKGNLTRRMSMAVDSLRNNTDSLLHFDRQLNDNNLFKRPLTPQPKRIAPKSKPESTTKAKNSCDGSVSPQIIIKKRKLNDATNASPESAHFTMHPNGINGQTTPKKQIQVNASPLKFTETLRTAKPRKLFSPTNDSIESDLDTQVIANIQALNKMSASSKRSPTAKTLHSTEMSSLCNAVIEKNVDKVANYIRTSFTAVFDEFLNITDPFDHIQSLENQLHKQRIDYNARIDHLQTQKNYLKQELGSLNKKHDELSLKNQELQQQNNELNLNLATMKMKNAKMVADLNTAIGDNARLMDKWRGVMTKNRDLKTMMTKLKESNAQMDTRLKDSEAENAELMATNRSSKEKQERLRKSLQTVLETNAVNPLRDETSECNLQ